MLHRTSELKGTHIHARDGEIGRCKDLLFDDHQWTVRYLVVETSPWITGRKVLISPISVGSFDVSERSRRLTVELTRQQIREAPPLDEDAPVSRQHEVALHTHYGYAYYWQGPGNWGAMPSPWPLRHPQPETSADEEQLKGDPHLRSVQEVVGYSVHARDGNIGHVHDFLLDDETWTLRHLIVDIGSWLAGRKVLIVPGSVTGCDWARSRMSVDLTKEQIEKSPNYPS